MTPLASFEGCFGRVISSKGESLIHIDARDQDGYTLHLAAMHLATMAAIPAHSNGADRTRWIIVGVCGDSLCVIGEVMQRQLSMRVSSHMYYVCVLSIRDIARIGVCFCVCCVICSMEHLSTWLRPAAADRLAAAPPWSQYGAKDPSTNTLQVVPLLTNH
jgi:hypothetical protein